MKYPQIEKILNVLFFALFIITTCFLIYANYNKILGRNNNGKMLVLLSAFTICWFILFLLFQRYFKKIVKYIIILLLSFGILFNFVLYNKFKFQTLPKLSFHSNNTMSDLNKIAYYSDYDYPVYFYFYDYQNKPTIYYKSDLILIKYGIRPELLGEWGNTILKKTSKTFLKLNYSDSIIIRNYNHKTFNVKSKIIITNSQKRYSSFFIEELNDSNLYFYPLK